VSSLSYPYSNIPCYNPTHLKLSGIVTHISNIPHSTIWHRLSPHGTVWHHTTPASTIWHRHSPYRTIWHHMALAFTIWNHMALYGTPWYHVANTAQDGRWKRYIRTHISDSLIRFPKDQIISFIQLQYKASQLATLHGILQALLVSLHTSSLIHLFTCLPLTHWLSDRDPTCSLSKLALPQLLSILAPALSGLLRNKL
jgi:hypothetical protein